MSLANVRIELMNKDNFDTWKIQVKALLVKNDEWGYVAGTINRPTKSALVLAAWNTADSKVMSDLILSISPNELKHVKNCKTSREIWEKLKSTYESQDPVRIAMLLKRLLHSKMNDKENMRTHLAIFFDVFGKLKNMDLKIDPDIISILLLYIIPNSYEPFRIAIESKDKLLKPDSLKMIEEYESRMRKSDNGEATALLASRRGERSKRSNRNDTTDKKDNRQVKCFRKQFGHFARNCKKDNQTNKPISESSNETETAMSARDESMK